MNTKEENKILKNQIEGMLYLIETMGYKEVANQIKERLTKNNIELYEKEIQ